MQAVSLLIEKYALEMKLKALIKKYEKATAEANEAWASGLLGLNNNNEGSTSCIALNVAIVSRAEGLTFHTA